VRIKRRPTPKLLAVVQTLILLLSISQPVVGGDPQKRDAPAGQGILEELHQRDPHELYRTNPSGKIVPVAQGKASLDEALVRVADLLNGARDAGYLTITDDFDVSLTEGGRKFVEETVSQSSGGCDRVTEVSADFTGIHVSIEPTCTVEEVGSLTTDSPAIKGAGFAPPLPAEPESNAVTASQDYNCILEIAGYLVGLVGLVALVWFPPTTWASFWIGWSVVGADMAIATLSAVNNCTYVVAAELYKRYWSGSYYIYFYDDCPVRVQKSFVWDPAYRVYVPRRVYFDCRGGGGGSGSF
jgi:hypothetical protein